MGKIKSIGNFLASLVGVGGEYAAQKLAYKGQQEANKTNIMLAREARDYDQMMWNQQNAYNAPTQQMQRLKEAGLNPNLIYGSGATTVAQSPKASPVPRVGNELAAVANASIIPALSLYQDWQVKKAQIDNIKAEADAKRQNASLTALRQISQEYTNKKLGIEMPWWSENALSNSVNLRNKANISQAESVIAGSKERYYQEAYPALLRQIVLRNTLLNEQKKSLELSNDLNRSLKPFGMTERDPVWLRALLKNIGKIENFKPKF